MLKEKVLNTIEENNLIQKNDKIVIGVSGGPDSMCLLDILYSLKNELNIELVVSHINHGLREEAEEETIYVEEYCKKRNIPVFIKRVKIKQLAEQQKLGTEEMGRAIRYNFFEEIAKKVGANKIATAHNLNDNAETVLMNILRGTAISGLKGIEISRKNAVYNEQKEICANIKGDNIKNNIKAENSIKSENIESSIIEGKNIITELTYIRPLRECSRTEIEEYCKEEKLNPKIDKTNLENIYTRNKIRNKLIPYLQEEFNPNIIESLNRLSNLAKQDEEYFANLVKEQYEALKIQDSEEKGKILKAENSKEKILKVEENSKEKTLKIKESKIKNEASQIEANNKKQNKNLKIEETQKQKYETSKIGENEKEIVLDLKKFNELPKVIKTRLILYTINKVIGTTQGIQKIHLEDIIKLCQNNIGNKYLTPKKNIKIFVKKGQIFIKQVKSNLP